MPPGESARSSTATRVQSSSAAATAAAGKGRKDTSFSSPTASSSSAELVHDVLDRAGRGAEGDDRALGVLQTVRLERPVPASRQPLEVGCHLVEDDEGGLERRRLLAAQLEVVVGHGEGSLRRRPCCVEHRVRDPVGPDEPNDLVVGQERHGLGRVRDREAVEADEHREQDARVLGDPWRHDHQVVRLLRVLGEELDDAGVPDEHRVGVVAVDVDRPRERPVAERHHDRRAHRGGDVDHLGHQGKPLGGRRGHRATACERSADRSAHGGVLGLHVDDLGTRLPVRDELREGLDDRRLRSDRIHRHDVGIDLPHRVGNGLAAGEEPKVGHSGHHLDRGDRTDVGADSAALAVVEVEARERLAVDGDRRIGAVEPAEQAVHAQRQVDGGLLARSPAAGEGPRRVGGSHDPCHGQLLPGAQLVHAYPSASARRTSWAATLRPSVSVAASCRSASGSSPSSAATAPSMTRFTKSEPSVLASRCGRNAAHMEAVELGRRVLAVHEHDSFRLQSVRDARLVHERGLEHDDDVGIRDRVVPADRAIRDARERPQGRSTALRTVFGERLDTLPAAQQRQSEDLRSRLGALAGARMPADLGHAVHRSASSSAETARLASATA